MNEDLKYTFSTVNDWLKFAEAKNAGLLALNLACLFGVIQADSLFSKDLKTLEGLLVVLFSFSSCFCLYALSPVVDKGFRFYKKMKQGVFNNSLDSINALFFPDIAKLSADQFSALFEHKHGVSLSSAEKDFSNQITNNAQICVQKYGLFTVASYFTFGALILGICLMIIHSFV